jgi:hypothetical protein
MKKEFTVFVCDNCAKELTIVSHSGFPYKTDWCYLYQFSGKLKPSALSHVVDINLRDSHFCSAHCFSSFLTRVIHDKLFMENPR